MGQTAFASLFQTDCARECLSNCNGKATEFVNNGSNINDTFTAIKNTPVAKIICSVVAQLHVVTCVTLRWLSGWPHHLHSLLG